VKAYVVIFAIATVVCALLTPLVRRLASRLQAVAVPSARTVHAAPIPRLGGVAIVLAFFAPLVVMFFVPDSGVANVIQSEWRRTLGLLVGGIAMAALGFRDDTKGVRALYKLFAHIVVAIIAFAAGFKIDAVAIPFIGELSMGVFALPVTVLWIVGVINAINLIDGLDGLAAGVVFCAGVTNLVVSYLSGEVFIGAIMAAMLGAVLGFLFYNFNPARIFMGDSGSYFLGFILATMSLAGGAQKASTAVSLLVPIIALGLPIFDTLFAIVRRFLERRPIFSPDRGHIHHRLLDMGITHRRAVLILYAISVVFTVAAIGVSLGHSWQVGVAILVAACVMLGFVRFVGYFEYLHIRTRQRARLRSRHSELLRFLLPDVPSLFSTASTEADIWAAMDAVLARAELRSIELVPSGTTTHAHKWSTQAPLDAVGHALVTATYPIGPDDRARASLRFAWHSDYGDASPQSEVLLQVIVDVVSRGLERIQSEYAPAHPSPAPESDPAGAPAAAERVSVTSL
jgi:UDP-GlcNAc:undecaprenyl-phosphate GlcNAc-1-phosphate transferase